MNSPTWTAETAAVDARRHIERLERSGVLARVHGIMDGIETPVLHDADQLIDEFRLTFHVPRS